MTARKTNPYSTMKETLMSDPSHEATGLDIPNFPLLTAMTNGLRGLWVIGGSTGRGKSTLAANIVANVAKPGFEVYYLDLENDTGVVTREIGDRIASAYGIDHPSLDHLRGYRRLGDLEHDMGHYLVPPALIVVDHIQLLAKGEDGSQRRASLDGIVRRCQEWALDGYTVLALSQLGRGADHRRPTLTDFRESGGIENGAAVALHVWKQNAWAEPRVYVVKLRGAALPTQELQLRREPGLETRVDKSGQPIAWKLVENQLLALPAAHSEVAKVRLTPVQRAFAGREPGAILRTDDIIRSMGMLRHWDTAERHITKAVKAGQIERVRKGAYRVPVPADLPAAVRE